MNSHLSTVKRESFLSKIIHFNNHVEFSINSILISFTFFLSLMDPRPRTDILHIVSSCSLLSELPFGPNSFPTKLNCNDTKQIGEDDSKIYLYSQSNSIIRIIELIVMPMYYHHQCTRFSLFISILFPFLPLDGHELARQHVLLS